MIACPNFAYNFCDSKYFVMVSANSELESPRTGALLEGVTKNRRIRKCASAEVDLVSILSGFRTYGSKSTHRGYFETDDNNRTLTFLIRNTQLLPSSPRAGANRASMIGLAAAREIWEVPLTFP